MQDGDESEKGFAACGALCFSRRTPFTWEAPEHDEAPKVTDCLRVVLPSEVVYCMKFA